MSFLRTITVAGLAAATVVSVGGAMPLTVLVCATVFGKSLIGMLCATMLG